MAQGPVTQRTARRVQGLHHRLAWAPMQPASGDASAEATDPVEFRPRGCPLATPTMQQSGLLTAMDFLQLWQLAAGCRDGVFRSGAGMVISPTDSVLRVAGSITAWQPGVRCLQWRGQDLDMENATIRPGCRPLPQSRLCRHGPDWSPLVDQPGLAGHGQGVCIWALPLASAQICQAPTEWKRARVLPNWCGVDPPSALVAGLNNRAWCLAGSAANPCSRRDLLEDFIALFILARYPAGQQDTAWRRRPRPLCPAQRPPRVLERRAAPGIRIGSAALLFDSSGSRRDGFRAMAQQSCGRKPDRCSKCSTWMAQGLTGVSAPLKRSGPRRWRRSRSLGECGAHLPVSACPE